MTFRSTFLNTGLDFRPGLWRSYLRRLYAFCLLVDTVVWLYSPHNISLLFTTWLYLIQWLSGSNTGLWVLQGNSGGGAVVTEIYSQILAKAYWKYCFKYFLHTLFPVEWPLKALDSICIPSELENEEYWSTFSTFWKKFHEFAYYWPQGMSDC